ncbi:MAG: DNA-binding response regulator, partial [Sphingobacteriaceae bacterium]|nr:DNA-binding response regulator [Cytophagaceae bacterium]
MQLNRLHFRTFLAYGLALGGLLALMTWAKYRFLIADHATELYVLLIAGLFTAVGI